MKINTRVFGEIEVDEEKIIQFPDGIVGFADLKSFVLIHDSEVEGGIRWLQSIEEPGFAMPVIDPLIVKSDYNPMVEDELLKRIGSFAPEDLLVLTTISVPKDVTKMTVNLMAPFVINTALCKAIQVILEDYEVKFPVYEILQNNKKAGE